MILTIADATEDDAAAIARLRVAVAEELTRRHGEGHWSSRGSEKGVLHAIRTSRVLVAREGGSIAATLVLATKKPWAIDRSFFQEVARPLYLIDMAVDPARQGRGLGRSLLVEAESVARACGADAIVLDAYDGPAGAGPFYAKCGFREVGRVSYRGVPLVYFQRLL